MRLALLLAYEGTRWSGWQIQEKPNPPPTIQGAVETALARIAGGAVRVFGAGRTDAGVHAHGQVAHCDIPDAVAAREARAPAGADRDGRAGRWRRALNALLPEDVRVLAAREARPDFHARIDALHKTYVYAFWTERGFTPPSLAPRVWACGPLDADAMRAAAAALIGRHDFASFRNAGTETETTTRTLLSLELEELPPPPFLPPCAPFLRLTLRADGFLKQMARNIAGLLASCGRGRADPAAVPAMLAACDRRAMPAPTAPARGLALARIAYPDGDGFF